MCNNYLSCERWIDQHDTSVGSYSEIERDSDLFSLSHARVMLIY